MPSTGARGVQGYLNLSSIRRGTKKALDPKEGREGQA